VPKSDLFQCQIQNSLNYYMCACALYVLLNLLVLDSCFKYRAGILLVRSMWNYGGSKAWSHSFRSRRELQLWYRACLYPRLFEKFKNLKFKIWELNLYIWNRKGSQTKILQLKVLELVGLHKFDINFIIIEVHLKKDMNLFAPQLFLRMVDFVNRPWNSISRDGVLNKTVPRNHLFS